MNLLLTKSTSKQPTIAQLRELLGQDYASLPDSDVVALWEHVLSLTEALYQTGLHLYYKKGQ